MNKKALFGVLAVLVVASIAYGGYRFGQYLALSKAPPAPHPATKSAS